MTKVNLLEVGHPNDVRKQKVISARKAADRLGIAHNTFFKGLAAGYFVAQATIEGEGKNAYGFEVAYIDEVAKAIPRNLVGGQSLFTPEIRTSLKTINDRWTRKK